MIVGELWMVKVRRSWLKKNAGSFFMVSSVGKKGKLFTCYITRDGTECNFFKEGALQKKGNEPTQAKSRRVELIGPVFLHL
jgi:hypothetical protein